MTDEEGALWAWGRSRFGQLGLGSAFSHEAQAQQVPGVERVQSFSLGWGHAAAVVSGALCLTRALLLMTADHSKLADSRSTQLLTWGFPKHGRLGHSFGAHADADAEAEASVLGRCVPAAAPVQLPAGFEPREVRAGLDHTLVLAADGRVASFGDDSLRQLGRPLVSYAAGDQDAEAWVLRDWDGAALRVSQIACGLAHSLAITRESRVVCWGWNAAGALGDASPSPNGLHCMDFEGYMLQDGWTPGEGLRVWGAGDLRHASAR